MPTLPPYPPLVEPMVSAKTGLATQFWVTYFTTVNAMLLAMSTEVETLRTQLTTLQAQYDVDHP